MHRRSCGARRSAACPPLSESAFFRVNDGQSGSYSGLEVALWEVSDRRFLIASELGTARTQCRGRRTPDPAVLGDGMGPDLESPTVLPSFPYFPVFGSPRATPKLLETLEIRALKKLRSANTDQHSAVMSELPLIFILRLGYAGQLPVAEPLVQDRARIVRDESGGILIKQKRLAGVASLLLIDFAPFATENEIASRDHHRAVVGIAGGNSPLELFVTARQTWSRQFAYSREP